MTERMVESLILRPAAGTDEWAVRRLFGALHDFNASLDPRFALADGWQAVLREHLRRRSAQHSLNMLAWAGATPVGLLMMEGQTDSPLFRHRHWAELLALYVDPGWRGTALAERLVESGTAWAREHGYERVQLYVTRSNAAAQAFYVRRGFQPVQEIWRLELGDSPRPPDDPGPDAGPHLLAVHQHGLLGDDRES